MQEPDNLSPEPLMRVPELARYLNLAESTIRNKVSKGEIPHKKVGTQVRFRREEIDRWIEAQSNGGGST